MTFGVIERELNIQMLRRYSHVGITSVVDSYLPRVDMNLRLAVDISDLRE